MRFYVSMTLRHRWPVMWSDIIMDRVAKGGYEVSQQKLDNMVRGYFFLKTFSFFFR